jgi:hypothetical protein
MIRPRPRHKRREQGEQSRGYLSTISCHLVFAATFSPLKQKPHFAEIWLRSIEVRML